MNEQGHRHVGPEIATCRYQAFIPDMGTPVNITRMPPRWKLPYTISARIGELAPTAEEFRLDGMEFDTAYRRRLDGMGIDHVLDLIARAVPEGRAVLLCYEEVWASTDTEGEVCHRRTLARWITEHTGQDVPELSPRTSARASRQPRPHQPSTSTPTSGPAPLASPRGSMAVEVLVAAKADNDYRSWVERHPDGRVLNRQPDGSAKTHRPTCPHFWTDATRFEPTLRPKVCVPDPGHEEAVAAVLGWVPLSRCGTCSPT